MIAHLLASDALRPLMLNLPPELWSETFYSFPRKNLISLHAASHLFHQIARPLIFEEFHFHPFQNQDLGERQFAVF
jgi:hypothetical protein